MEQGYNFANRGINFDTFKVTDIIYNRSNSHSSSQMLTPPSPILYSPRENPIVFVLSYYTFLRLTPSHSARKGNFGNRHHRAHSCGGMSGIKGN